MSGDEQARILDKHQRHVEASPGVGETVKSYALAVIADIRADFVALPPPAGQDERMRAYQQCYDILDDGSDSTLFTLIHQLKEEAESLAARLAEAQRESGIYYRAGRDGREDVSNVGSQIGAAVNGHVKALRLLGRTETTMLQIAEALGLPEPIVESAFVEFQIAGAKVTSNKKAKCATMSTVINLKPAQR